VEIDVSFKYASALSAKKSQAFAHFSNSCRDSSTILPISREIVLAYSSLFLRTRSPALFSNAARFEKLSLRQLKNAFSAFSIFDRTIPGLSN
jgi:hypothetical protein